VSGDKKARQQRAKAAMREQAAREWEEHMVLEPAQLKDLLDHLDESLGRVDCDHSLRVTRAWATDNGIDQAALEGSVLHFGGGCDCEVLANVDPQTQVNGWPRYLEQYGPG
jgi:uncharacterized protein DUF2695